MTAELAENPRERKGQPLSQALARGASLGRPYRRQLVGAAAWGGLGRMNHLAIVVPNLVMAMDMYRTALGATVGEPKQLPAHGVTAAFVDLGNTQIELLAN